MSNSSLAQSARFWLGYGANCLKEWLLAEGRMPPVRWIPWGSSWCYDLRRCFAAAGKKSPHIIFDVGANIGQTALYLHAHFPQAQIHAFEPVDTAFAQLELCAKKSPRHIHCHHLALGEEKGTKKMAICSDAESSTMRAERFGQKDVITYQEVPVTTIDAFVHENHIPRIECLKVDVEGYEMPVFRGAEQTLRSGKILAIFAEVVFNNKNPDRRWTEFDEANTYLRPKGFDLVNFYDIFRCGSQKEILLFCNALWVNWDALYATDEQV